MSDTTVFAKYWSRKRLLNEKVPHFPVRRWANGGRLCDIEAVYLQALKGKNSVLDVGAGDLRVKNRLVGAGFSGDYHTQDIAAEHHHTYRDLTQVRQTYDAIICLDVIEHMTFEEGIALIRKMDSLLNPGGVLILQTPNGRCIRDPLAWDMTHRHCYNLPDLWALFTSEGYRAEGYRVVFEGRGGLKEKFYGLLGKFVITRLIGADYADNIALIAHKGAKK